jgi:hypothetical protein
MMPGLNPAFFNLLAREITTGVFPVPPVVMLPTTMIGTGSLCARKKWNRKSRRRVAVTNLYTSASGSSEKAMTFILLQNLGIGFFWSAFNFYEEY